MNPRVFRTIAVVIIITTVVGGFFWDTIMKRMESGEEYRMRMIRIAFTIMQSNPVLGVGLFNYEYHSYNIFSFWQPVHNTYLRLATETGIPGGLLFLWLLFTIFREAYQALELKDKLLNLVGMGIFCGFTAFCVAILFGPQYQHYRHKFLFWVLAGLAVSLKRIRIAEIQDIKGKQEAKRLRTLGDPATRRSRVPSPPPQVMPQHDDGS